MRDHKDRGGQETGNLRKQFKNSEKFSFIFQIRKQQETRKTRKTSFPRHIFCVFSQERTKKKEKKEDRSWSSRSSSKERKRKEIFLKRKRFCSFLRVRARALWRSQPAAKPAPRSSARGRGLSSQQPAAARFSCKIRWNFAEIWWKIVKFRSACSRLYRRIFGFSLRFRWEFDFMLQFLIEKHQNL